MSGTFILSLDCEGKWGVSHNIDELHQRALTSDALTTAYEKLTAMLGRYDIAATFAFVMGFLLKRDEFQALTRADDQWLEPYRRSLNGGHTEGWHLPRALEIVQSAGSHEIACHGFCHRPFGNATPGVADEELQLAGEVAKAKGVSPDTFVFPYNQVAHVGLLKKHGFIGYRERLNRSRGAIGRAITLAEEFNLWPRAQPRRAGNGITPIPSGYFVNWRHGARKRVPLSVSVARLKNLVRSAARTGGVAHIWLHPHNLVTAPSTGLILDAVLAEAAKLRDRGELQIQTQREYCRHAKPAS